MRPVVHTVLLATALLQLVACGRDHYKVLNISRDCDATTIKKAYRKLAKEYHPDRNPDDKTAHEKFQEIGAAYEILSNPEKRQNYDMYGGYQEADDSPSHGFQHPFAHFGHVPFPMFFGDMFGSRHFQFQQRQRRHEDMMFSFVRGSQGGRYVKIVLFQ